MFAPLSANFDAILFIGGWSASACQYAFPGTYVNALYDGHAETKAIVNRLIKEFSAQNKYLTAIRPGVSVLAWARVNGVSPLAGHHATGGPYGPSAGFFRLALKGFRPLRGCRCADGCRDSSPDG